MSPPPSSSSSSPSSSSPSSEDAYTLLSTYLLSPTPLEISLLPSITPSILFTPPHLGIPKRQLLDAFAHAHALFFPASPAAAPPAAHDVVRQQASLLLLLASSEHVTAINARKRLLLSATDAPITTPPAPPAITPQLELSLTHSLLTSALMRHNKSPAIWAYRRWLLITFRTTLLPAAVDRELGEKLGRELAIVRASAEQHAKNYYAWEHARWAVGFFGSGTTHGADTPAADTADMSADTADTSADMSADMIAQQLRWCRQHVSDVSGWTFLAWVLERSAAGVGAGAGAREGVLAEVLKFAVVAPGHEALWAFVRIVAVGLEREAWERVLVKGVGEREGEGGGEGGGEERERDRVLREKAVAWVAKWGGGRTKAAEHGGHNHS
ncbi:hypothetical protein BZA05DRAFT_150048 [Tricharina praecox]|uniref:uncharacterized protein n=1 Tax=Tricharina praecox TaxID=43433 RepID=UPI00221ED917|nr:uncharacterized protein BZA05DRAFT_150048 [Tricharina praecox]KAI5845425.1 hypothetical protein BZA05DRAFT_150048 [Tricharina praecox]